MVNESAENDHAFSVEADIFKLNEAGDRVLIEGHIGELIEADFVEGLLEIKGSEANLKISLDQEELRTLLSNRTEGNRKP